MTRYEEARARVESGESVAVACDVYARWRQEIAAGVDVEPLRQGPYMAAFENAEIFVPRMLEAIARRES